MKTAPLAAILALLVAGVFWLSQAPSAARHLLISGALARPLEDGSLVAVLSIENSGAPDRLVSVSSPSADVALYSPVDVAGAPIPVGKSTLALDGAHIRVTPRDASYGDGTLIPLALEFALAGEVLVKARLSDPAVAGDAGKAGLFGIGDICVTGDGEPAPSVALEVTRGGDGWRVAVVSNEFEFTPDLLGLMHVPGTGHGHLYVGGIKLGRLLSPEAQIGALPKGRHEVRVTLNTNDHRAYVVGETPVTATATIEVD